MDETLAERTYRAVRSAIGTGQLRGGEKVTERGLAERFDVSPTPVREAIRRLEQDGLIERTGPRTVTVAAIPPAAIEDLVEVEVALRGLVARFATRHATPAQLDELDGILDDADDLMIVVQQRRRAGDPAERQITALLDVMARFNDAVTACAGNPVLARLLEQTRVFSPAEGRARRLARIAAGTWTGLDRYATHRAFVRALRERDADRAERIVLDDAQGGLDDLRD
jgi:DNA-binding GntR family transcriptional regulator